MSKLRLRLAGALLVAGCSALVTASLGAGQARAATCTGSPGIYFELGVSNVCNFSTSLSGSAADSLILSNSLPGATALLATATASTGNGWGVAGETDSSGAEAYGVIGILSSASPGNGSAGVYGRTNSTTGIGAGVQGVHLNIDGTSPGVYGQTNAVLEGPTAAGVSGSANSGSTGVLGYGGNGVWGSSVDSNGTGVLGTVTGAGHGVRGQAGADGVGVFGKNAGTTGATTYGVEGTSASSANLAAGVYGVNSGTSALSTGVYGSAPSGTGLVGIGGNYGLIAYGGALSGLFLGDVAVTGTLTKGAGAFRIDHPLDPAHKYLQHSFVESPDMKDVYDGVVTTDAKGFATVKLPNWFQALNRDFRYQLTILGHSPWGTEARVWDEIAHNSFTVRTNKPNVKVSWQVTGIRHDPYANAHRIQTVVAKPAAEQGKYLHPELYGKPKTAGIAPQKLQKAVRGRD